MNNDWLDIELLEDYLDGKLDSKAMHRIEKQALEDPFVAQALAGLSESPKRASQNVSLLQKQLYERIGQQQVAKKESVYTWQRLSIAAAAAVMFISVSIIFFMREQERRTEIAKLKNQPKNIEVNIAPSASLPDSAVTEDYAANPKPVGVGQISPRRKMENQPVQVDAALSADVQGVKQDTAKAGTQVAASKVNARIASVLPAATAPVGGWASLDTYITDHNAFTKNGSTGKFVELSFGIDAEGNPSEIRIEKGVAKEFDDEAVRLIKDGPRWEQPKSAGARISYTIAF
ncbi:TonB family C-terminal domain-containing protein [Pedobacter westerhofensis]|uniref:TonB family C-terminal domain-containing protein n=1 Tax=Pedobacter westerhofensis TaxID=425512 RepID=A0A521EHU9_9SPHI|nr:energy transducer TonB [Pedobacter westerhofensis]SMO83422.1 TonB family C-terminal domain-containing protein [Pedobacter westerhofensis]